MKRWKDEDEKTFVVRNKDIDQDEVKMKLGNIKLYVLKVIRGRNGFQRKYKVAHYS